MNLLPAVLIVFAAYLLGSVSFAVVVSKAFALPDPQEYGSGNPGATNVLRTGNKAAALLTLAGDGIKAWLAIVLAGVPVWQKEELPKPGNNALRPRIIMDYSTEPS